LAWLHETFARAQRGERQVVFVLGEAGIGKTTLVDRFLQQVQASEEVRVGRGQCVEQHGTGEAYLPMLEALGQLCREPGGEQVLAVLRRHAPLWLVQMAGLLEADEREALQRQVQGSSRERMLRELAEAVER
jgi:predicted ATPase